MKSKRANGGKFSGTSVNIKVCNIMQGTPESPIDTCGISKESVGGNK